MTVETACYVKARWRGDRRFHFLGSRGQGVQRRMHAALLWDREKAERIAADVLTEPDVVAVAVMQGGRRVYFDGEKLEPRVPLYGPENGYRYVVDVTKAGRAVCHVKDDEGLWADASWDEMEACFEEAARAGATNGIRVHATTFGMSGGQSLTCVQEVNRVPNLHT